MTVIKYETPVIAAEASPRPWVFLAGPTVRGNQTHLISWRREATELFKKSGFKGTLIIPEFEDKTASDKDKEWIPLWEYNGLIRCDHILMWIPRTRELIGLTTNFEFGYWMARARDKITYGRPDDAFRIKYIDLMWQHDNAYYGGALRSAQIFNTLPATVAEVMKRTAQKEGKDLLGDDSFTGWNAALEAADSEVWSKRDEWEAKGALDMAKAAEVIGTAIRQLKGPTT